MSPAALYDYIIESRTYLKGRGVEEVDGGLILGSGMGSIADDVEQILSVRYSGVPHMGGASVLGHAGRLIYGMLEGKKVLVFSGRIHFYEGFSMWQVAYPMRIISSFGANWVLTTSAAGGLNEQYETGDLVLIRDHISMMSESPLRGPHDPRLGPRFPDMSQPYSPSLRKKLLKLADGQSVDMHEGVYLGLPGPSLETVAEYQYMNQIGADLVGMSIIPEVIVAAQSGLEVAGMSIVSNVCYPPERVTPTTAEEVVREVNQASGQLKKVIRAFCGND